MRRQRNDYLFCTTDWFSVRDGQEKSLQSEIDGVDGNRLLNTSVDDLCDFFEKNFRIDVPVLAEDKIVADQREVQIDVSQDRMRHVRDRSQPFHMSGTCVEVTVPFAGKPATFQIQPSRYTSSPPRGKINSDTLVLEIAGVELDPEKVKAEIDQTLANIGTYLEWLRSDVRGFNEQIRQRARERIHLRRQKLLSDQSLVANLGFPLRERTDPPLTFTAPNVQRRLAPTMPPASITPYEPEPALSSEDYEHILSVVENMTLVMERSPSAFTSMGEEALRTHFLVQLNGLYMGQATGETFNYDGKTDILVRTEGKNIFIAECKFWEGPKQLGDTIDQLLGYVSWRDTKTAIIIFNRNRDFSRVLSAIPDTVKSHPNCKRAVSESGEGRFQYIFGHRDDANREMILTVLAFDVPQIGRNSS